MRGGVQDPPSPPPHSARKAWVRVVCSHPPSHTCCSAAATPTPPLAPVSALPCTWQQQREMWTRRSGCCSEGRRWTPKTPPGHPPSTSPLPMPAGGGDTVPWQVCSWQRAPTCKPPAPLGPRPCTTLRGWRASWIWLACRPTWQAPSLSSTRLGRRASWGGMPPPWATPSPQRQARVPGALPLVGVPSTLKPRAWWHS